MDFLFNLVRRLYVLNKTLDTVDNYRVSCFWFLVCVTPCTELGVQKVFLLKIDVEGHELHALKGFNLSRFRPLWITLEYFPMLLRTAGTAPERLHVYLVKNGYSLVDTSGCNKKFSADVDGDDGFRKMLQLIDDGHCHIDAAYKARDFSA